ncbi:trypsin-like peptidase domain-containing protein [Agathobaculum sp.]|uniref:trypsin-like peptidase domain-containing protein n=1 Tax=Agathobaculum sp. TaxID=2048138 RepID=UPI002A7EC5A2|nr:trypsin-like peptidase domain-containing protein [Agathobaculum sp.]MDY3617630.1 trypsin-like peptidase domain-containing protein [Agathobaculum sp.]
MKKKLLSMLLAVLLAAGAVPQAAAGYENFQAVNSYSQGQFSDVAASAWYAQDVALAYEYGLINGRTASTFAPDGLLTLGEAVKLAACLNSMYETGSAAFEPSKPWYQTYVDYALDAGVLAAPYADYNANATRAQFAALFAAALPEEALAAVNDVEDGAIPDVPQDSGYADAVYRLYRAGVLTGSDARGTFHPDSPIKRSEVAAIAARMADETRRKTVSFTAPMDRQGVYDACMPAVFKLYSYNEAGKALGVGSGVVISEDGEAVTCGHVVNGAHGLTAEFADGTRVEVEGIYDMDAVTDLARLKLSGSGFAYVEIDEKPVLGESVFILGYPGGGDAKLTAGELLATDDDMLFTPLLRTNASARSGNSGGALVNAYGKLIGIVSNGEDQTSYAVPISNLAGLSGSVLSTMDAYTKAHMPDASQCYSGLYPVPDFGKVAGATPVGSERAVMREGTAVHYYYALPSSDEAFDRLFMEYYKLCMQHSFYRFSGDQLSSSAGYPYIISFGQQYYRGRMVLVLQIISTTPAVIGGLPKAAAFLSV